MTIDTSKITAPPLPAHRDVWERQLLSDPRLLGQLADVIGGPFHVMFPERVEGNVRDFQDTLTNAGVPGTVYYARKANKAACVIDACARVDAGVDVSSIGELTAALGGGVRGRDLMITGPAKSDRLLWLAARHGALIAIDALDELDRLIGLAQDRVRVLLRVHPSTESNGSSRFGLSDSELAAAFDRLAHSESLVLDGFSFHLPGYDPAPRARLAAELIDRCRQARALGHPASTISIGGGFAVDYVDRESWARFTGEIDDHWFYAGDAVRTFYPYHSEIAGAAMLARILETDDLASRLRDHAVRLAVEPGRSLLDRAGITVFGVQGVKIRSEHGLPYRLITVDGTSLSLSEQWFGSEYLPDPVLWPAEDLTADAPVVPEQIAPTCVGGATCLEDDLLSRRRIPLAREPRIGDLLVYPNTAGYQMDSNESTFQNHPIPPKIVLRSDLRWSLDHSIGETS